MRNAVGHGADRLVHLPGSGLISAETARRIRDVDCAIATTVSFSSPEWDTAMGRERQPARARTHAQILKNIRLLWYEGVTVAYGTDSAPGLDFMAEVRALSSVLISQDIIISPTRHAAEVLYLT